MNKIIETVLPKRVIKNKFKFPIWFDNELKPNIIKKRRAHRIYRDSGTVDDYLVFNNLRALCNKQAQMCYNNYILDVQQGVQQDAKKNFWRYVHSETYNNEIPSFVRYDHLTVDNRYALTHIFQLYTLYHLIQATI